MKSKSSNDQSQFRISSYCDAGSCVGVAKVGDTIVVVNTSDRQKKTEFSLSEWSIFLQGVKAGEFDTDSLR